MVRGYITGSAWEEYIKTGMLGGYKLPGSLKFCEKLPEPIFTPTTKETSGHDISLTISQAKNKFGSELIDFLEKKSIEIYKSASKYALIRE